MDQGHSLPWSLLRYYILPGLQLHLPLLNVPNAVRARWLDVMHVCPRRRNHVVRTDQLFGVTEQRQHQARPANIITPSANLPWGSEHHVRTGHAFEERFVRTTAHSSTSTIPHGAYQTQHACSLGNQCVWLPPWETMRAPDKVPQ